LIDLFYFYFLFSKEKTFQSNFIFKNKFLGPNTYQTSSHDVSSSLTPNTKSNYDSPFSPNPNAPSNSNLISDVTLSSSTNSPSDSSVDPGPYFNNFQNDASLNIDFEFNYPELAFLDPSGFWETHLVPSNISTHHQQQSYNNSYPYTFQENPNPPPQHFPHLDDTSQHSVYLPNVAPSDSFDQFSTPSIPQVFLFVIL